MSKKIFDERKESKKEVARYERRLEMMEGRWEGVVKGKDEEIRRLMGEVERGQAVVAEVMQRGREVVELLRGMEERILQDGGKERN